MNLNLKRIAALLLLGSSALWATGAVAAAPLPTPDHIVIVMEENHGIEQIIGSSNAPYINALATGGALFNNSFGVTHPSQPNYLALFSGSVQGITDDSCPHWFTGANLASSLISAGLTFGGYSEDLPSVGYTGCTINKYARKHAPWVNFTNVPTSDNMPMTSFPTDFTKLPKVSFVIPNLNDDMHDGTVQAGDTWLKSHIDAYAQWAKLNNSLLIVTWDEDDTNGANQIATIFYGPMVKTGLYSETINHYNVLRTVEDIYGLPELNNSASATPISDVWNVMHEFEKLPVVGFTTGDVERVAVDAQYSGGEGVILEAHGAANFVSFTANVPEARVYDIRVGIKKDVNRGIWQFDSNGVNHGGRIDGYAATKTFTEVDLGNATFSSAGNKTFRFTTTGKNASSTDFWMALDYIKLIPQ